jgi:hypothetical protein
MLCRGGFFVAVLRKTRPWPSRTDHRRSQPATTRPRTPFATVGDADHAVARIAKAHGGVAYVRSENAAGATAV